MAAGQGADTLKHARASSLGAIAQEIEEIPGIRGVRCELRADPVLVQVLVRTRSRRYWTGGQVPIGQVSHEEVNVGQRSCC